MVTIQELEQQAQQTIPQRRIGSRVTRQQQRQVLEQRERARQSLQEIREQIRQEQVRESQSREQRERIERIQLALKRRTVFGSDLNREDRELVIAILDTRGRTKEQLQAQLQAQREASQPTEREIQAGQSLPPGQREDIVRTDNIRSVLRGQSPTAIEKLTNQSIADSSQRIEQSQIQTQPSVIQEVQERIRTASLENLRERAVTAFRNVEARFDPEGSRRNQLIRENTQAINNFNKRYGGRELSPEEFAQATQEEADIKNKESEIEQIEISRESQQEGFINKFILDNQLFSLVSLSEDIKTQPRLAAETFEKYFPELANAINPVPFAGVKIKTLVRGGLELGQFVIPVYGEIALGAYTISGTSKALSTRAFFGERLFGAVEAIPGLAVYGIRGTRVLNKYLNEEIEIATVTFKGKDVSLDEAIQLTKGQEPVITLAKTNIAGITDLELTTFSTRAKEIKRGVDSLFFDKELVNIITPRETSVTKLPSVSVTISDIFIIRGGKVVGVIDRGEPALRLPGTLTSSLRIKNLQKGLFKLDKSTLGTIEGGITQDISLTSVPKVYKKLVDELLTQTKIPKGTGIDIGEVITKDLIKGDRLLPFGKRTQAFRFAGVTKEFVTFKNIDKEIIKQVTTFEKLLPSDRPARKIRTLQSEVEVLRVDLNQFIDGKSNIFPKVSRDKIARDKLGKQLLLLDSDLKVLGQVRASAFAQNVKALTGTSVSSSQFTQLSSRELPSIVGGSGQSVSRFTGQALFERTESVSITRPRLRERTNLVSFERISQGEIQRELSRELNRQLERELSRELSREIQREVQRELQRELTRQIQRQVPRQPTINPPRLRPPIRPPRTPAKIGFKFPSLFEGGKKYKDLTQGFKTFVIKGGQKQFLPGVRTKGSALEFGEATARRTLRATFGVEKTGLRVREDFASASISKEQFRSYKIKSGRRIALDDIYIQRRGKRLSSRGEVLEIKQSKMRFKI